MYIQNHWPNSHHWSSRRSHPSKNLIFMVQCRKCKSTPNTPAEYIGQTKWALRDRFEEHRRAIQNKTEDAAPQHFNQPRHQLTSSNLSHSNLSTPKENLYVEPANVFTLKKHKLYAATGNKQIGQPLKNLCTYWFHYYYILYFILIYFIIMI